MGKPHPKPSLGQLERVTATLQSRCGGAAGPAPTQYTHIFSQHVVPCNCASVEEKSMPTNGHNMFSLCGSPLDMVQNGYRMGQKKPSLGNDTSTGCGLLLVETRAAEVVAAGWVGNFVPARETWCSSCHGSKSSRRGDEEMKESSNY